MACTRRSLATTFTHLSRGFHPSFTYVLHHDRDGNDAAAPPPPPPPPPPRSVPSFAGRGVGSHHPFLLDPFARRFYSSTAGGRSNETEFMSDGAEVLSDTSIETAIDAAASVPPAPFPGEVAAAAAGSVLPVAALQYLIDGVHSFSGLNWWASIAVTTVLIRGATIPLLLNTMRATAKLNKMRPDLEELKQQMQNSMDPESLQDGQKRMKALFAKHGVTPFTPLKGLLIQGPIFISFFLAISNMVEKVPSLKGGGAFWFTDLTTPDPSYMLPVLTSLTFLATVELNMQEGMEGNPMVHTMKNVSRGMALLTIPFTANFPKAIFCYWITSNLFSLTYGLAIKHPPVRKFLNLPDIVPQPTNPAPQPTNPAPQPNFTLFGGSKSIIPTAPPSPANEPEQDTAPPSPSKEPGQGTPSRRIVSTASVIKHRIRNLEKAVKARSKPKKN